MRSPTRSFRREDEPCGTLARLEDRRVFVALDAPPTESQVYQSWAIVATPESLGTFADRAFLSEECVAARAPFGLTLEPPGDNRPD